MPRFSVTNPEVQELVEQCLVPLYLDTGSVASVAKLLGTAAGPGASIHPNRVHTAMSGDPERALNEQSIESLRRAASVIGPRTDAQRVRDQARLSEIGNRALAASGGDVVDEALVADRLGIPRSVIRLGLAAVGQRRTEQDRSSQREPGAPDWSFQDMAVADCLDAFRRRPTGNVGLILPTGAGKTRTAFRITLEMLSRSGSPTSKAVWITHRKSLYAQASRELDKLIRDNSATLPPDAEDLAKRVVFLMLGEAPDAITAGVEAPALVVIDEAHHAAAASYQPILEPGRHDYPVLLLTATPNRLDQLPIGIDEIAFTITYRELAERGAIITPHFEPFEVPDFSLSAQTMDDLADLLVSDTADRFRKTLVLVTRVDQMRDLHERLAARIDALAAHPLRSGDVGFIDGSGNSHGIDNEDFLALFAAKPRSILISAQMLLEGYDDPGIDSVVITYRTESVIKLMQAAGRCVRYAPGKKEAWVIQADNPGLAYRFDQRWLYQEIDDRLLPELRDLEFSDMGEMLSLGAELLNQHHVDSRARNAAMAALATCSPDNPPRFMFYGLPYFGDPDRFESDARWGVFVETPANSVIFRAIYNGFSELGAERSDPSEFLDVIGPKLGLTEDAYAMRRQLAPVLTAAYFAHEELTRSDGAAQGNRGYLRNHSTTWLRYVTMRYRPVLPAGLSAFLADCHNRGSVEQEYSANPEDFALAVKTALPLGGCEAVLLEKSDAAALDEWLAAIRERLRLADPRDQFAQLASVTVTLTPPPLPMAHLLRAERLLSDEGRAAFAFQLSQNPERTSS